MPERRPARANLQPRAVGGARAPDRPAGRPAPDRSIAHPCALPGGHARPGRHCRGGPARGPSPAGCHPSGCERRAVDGDRVALVAQRERNGRVTRSRSWRRIVNRVGGPRRSLSRQETRASGCWGCEMAGMAERHWEGLRPSAAGRYDLDATGGHDRRAAERGRRRAGRRVKRQLTHRPPMPRSRATP
jgi:hypothetical protein